MILTEPIPGHEVRNEEFLLSHGAALSLSHPRELAPLIDRLFGDEEQLESLARAALALGRPEAAAKTVDLDLCSDRASAKLFAQLTDVFFCGAAS